MDPREYWNKVEDLAWAGQVREATRLAYAAPVKALLAEACRLGVEGGLRAARAAALEALASASAWEAEEKRSARLAEADGEWEW